MDEAAEHTNADLIRSPAYVLKGASDRLAASWPVRVHAMWQTEFSYFLIIDWNWYFLSTVLDDLLRDIMHERLRDPTGKV